MSFANGGRIVTDGLVLSLDASDRNSYVSGSATWTDLSGNGNNGTLVNGPTFDSGSGGSIFFDGVDDRINISTSPLIENLTANFTFQAFVKFNTSGGQYGIFTKGGRYANGWTVYLRQGPQFSLIGKDASGVSSGILAPTPAGGVTVDKWYHITYTYNQSVVISYINGIQSTTSNYSQNFNSTGTTSYIGWDADLSLPPNYWSGYISNINLYNRALLSQEVLQNYNAQKTRFNLK
jgi:Concanavalin A-like lectin/glucanases superfamily